ncbi:hypothetical protein [Pararhodospirillum oryzae]|uniref:Uncharacterized protein n=1 Tax=Pararhodospirillum oryzae TaxID=478448 RepID=A0A512HB65_9PROT|nr:hypothetical protein [Pararhodospirillum oryzae]GEO82696.1 hypothetical protein ROR02_28270 [Pararhodospirillum oryzae]
MAHPVVCSLRRRVGWTTARGVLLAGVLWGMGACTAFEPTEPSVPSAGTFNQEAARTDLSAAQDAEARGGLADAAAHYRAAAQAWPVEPEAWRGLARVAALQGDTPTQDLARFLADRVAEYDALHPRQARLAFLGAVSNPPPSVPGIKPWAETLVAFFEYKDAVALHDAFAARPTRSTTLHYAVYPVALGSLGVGAYALGASIGALGDSSGE